MSILAVSLNSYSKKDNAIVMAHSGKSQTNTNILVTFQYVRIHKSVIK